MQRRSWFSIVIAAAVLSLTPPAIGIPLRPAPPAAPKAAPRAECVPGPCGGTELQGNPGTIFREEWIPTDQPATTMHADVLRSANFTWAERQPVIVVATPYGNHAGQNNWNGGRMRRENGRFGDFLALSGALAKGYTYVVVDLPGYGGASGCSDLGGPLERAAVKRAVEWAAASPWSTGKVALFGKSYDGWTGLMGVAEKPAGLAAVIAMEPLYSAYLVDISNGIRNQRSFAMPFLYANIDAYPGTTSDPAEYHANSVIRPHCFAGNTATWANDDASAPGWVERDLRAASAGSDTPVFLVQGLLETNTVQRGAFDYFNSLAHPGNMAWYGQFDHVRPWERDPYSGQLQSGREGFVPQAMRFLDLHLKGVAAATADPVISIQDNLGRYRSENVWPPADAAPFVTRLNTGTFLDGPQHDGIFSTSDPLEHDVWLAGEPTITVDLITYAPRGNLLATLYDVDPSGRATEVSHDGYLVRGVGPTQVSFPMLGQDWVFAKGHRIAIELSSDNPAFVHVPSGGPLAIKKASVSLPLLTTGRTSFLAGQPTPRMGSGRVIYADTREAALVPFSVPGPIDTGAR